MTSIFVQFADSTETAVVAAFACPQDATEYPYQGEIDDTDARYVAFANPASTLSGARTAQIAVLTAACAATLTSAMTSPNVTNWATYRTTCLALLATLTTGVNAATAVSAVQAITWSAPNAS
jgi:hypothetical protein